MHASAYLTQTSLKMHKLKELTNSRTSPFLLFSFQVGGGDYSGFSVYLSTPFLNFFNTPPNSKNRLKLFKFNNLKNYNLKNQIKNLT